MTKNSVCCAFCLRNHTSYDLHLIFRVLSKIKGQEMAQNNEKLCLSHSISQKSYIIWLWFLVRMCKMMASLDDFFIFLKILILWVVRWVKRQKMAQYDKKLSVSLCVSGAVPHCVILTKIYFSILVFSPLLTYLFCYEIAG